MKKQLWGLAAISLLLGATSCTEETIETINDGKNQIEFKTALGKQTVTRAAEVGLTDLQGLSGGLTVESYYSQITTPFKTFNIKWSNGAWAYEPSVSQPGVPLRYYSVHPNTNIPYAEATGTSYTFDYAIQSTQEDLIVAKAGPELKPDITLEFQHVLSQVNFAVQGMPSVKIAFADDSNGDKISVTVPQSAGTYTFGSGWSLDDTEETYAYVPKNLDKLLAANSNEIIYLGNGGTASGAYSNDNALMLMPQAFTSTADGTFRFKFSLTVDLDGDGDFTDTSDGGAVVKENENGEETVVQLSSFQTTEWLPGKRYLYIIDFTSYLAGGPITFKVDVADWENDADVTTVETLHVPDATALSIEAAIAKHSAANAAFNAAEADKKKNDNNYTVKQLTKFPISVANDIADGKTVTITSIVGFDAGDKIVIELPKSVADGGGTLNINVPGWTRSDVDNNNRVVTFTCGTPITAAQVAPNVNVIPEDVSGTETITKDALEAAIAKQIDANTDKASLKVFPITVPIDITDNITIDFSGFDEGDRVMVICPLSTSPNSANKITGGTATCDNIVIYDTAPTP